MHTRLKNILFAIILLDMFAPLAQQLFNIPQPGLKGAYLPLEKPSFSLEAWMNGNWQQRYSDYYETTFGFRPWLIKIRNHLEYNLFRKVHGGIIVGKNDYLFEKPYIDTYLGHDRIPFDSASLQIQKLHEIENYLSQNNKHIITILAPGKGSFYAENIPRTLNPEKRTLTNYDLFSLLLRHTPIPSIDFSKYFRSHKDTMTHPLYTKFGIHWSSYSSPLVTDSIVRKMQNICGRNWGYYTTYNERETTSPLYSDDDLIQLVNTMGTSSGETYYYRDCKFTRTDKLPRVLIIGDSYVWPLIDCGAFLQSMDEGSQYYYYNHDIYTLTSGSLNRTGTKEKTFLPDNIEGFDFIILCNTEPTLHQIGCGFIDAFHQHLMTTGKIPRDLR
jgi:hypothetical protein